MRQGGGKWVRGGTGVVGRGRWCVRERVGKREGLCAIDGVGGRESGERGREGK